MNIWVFFNVLDVDVIKFLLVSICLIERQGGLEFFVLVIVYDLIFR